ncbi:hypothetical protein VE01_09948 [Pseudogymnoascus verrucosus]|uniref:Major facilitator superfamily (MFS) profile domain-containing protein n=1 Tax=Pseudogymnoascus verrucosus TaxID=342668 RepID=A0A1B8G814_9PEZI|nr:uncharacterized protein VE01_09948 [Pseudogymnoascus verrucosus]OBT91980.1 hypothetical protein VE01_09948 [Pseudogymnoascus verrucosus]
MSDLIREAPLGQFLRWATKNRLFPYPEELPGFELPESYNAVLRSEKAPIERPISRKQLKKESDESNSTPDSESFNQDIELQRTLSRQDTRQFTQERLETEIQDAIERVASKPIYPVKTADGLVLVDWYSTDDPANPQNWSMGKKSWVGLLICLYTFVVYTGSAIYTSSIPQVIEKFNISEVDASLPLSLYVLAYGMGPLVFSPLSEIPRIGRSPVYLVTMFIFTIISIPTALVNNFAGLLVLRFLQGFFGSPCLATGAATMSDMVSMLYLPYALIAWVSAAYCGPALGPLLSGFAVGAESWRWSLYEIIWAASPVLLLMFSVLPETSTPNILLRRAERLRKLTGESRLMAQSEIDQAKLSTREVVVDALIKPMEITIKDPAILFVNVYTAIIYGIYYSFFEVFPLVYPVYYGFSLGIIGVLFTCILIACLIGVAIYSAYLYFYHIPDIIKNGLRAQEHNLVPALFACFGPTIGLFIFAWTARPDITWVAPTIGIVLYGASVFIVMQCIFTYVPMSYPQYAASLFAGNDFLRSASACASILYAHPLYKNLGVARGTSLLGGLSVIGIVGIFLLWVFGAKLRARSKFAMH